MLFQEKANLITLLVYKLHFNFYVLINIIILIHLQIFKSIGMHQRLVGMKDFLLRMCIILSIR
jgi:hypothetical protein